MSRVVEVDPRTPGPPAALDDAATAIRSAQLIVLPTETVYGIACRPDDPAATARLFEAKARPSGLNLALLAATADDALALTRATPHATALATLWPGPLTMVLARADATRAWSLGDDADTVGVRVPDLPIALSLLARTGPLAVTSANRSGRPPATTSDELLAVFGDDVAVYLTIPGAGSGGQSPSTVIDLTDPPRIRLLRAGPYDRPRLAACVADSGPDPEWVDFPA